ncbi:Dyp-type peroxidase domain-containing protein, partial [Kitasatospora sp. MAP5-34]|uniref:Dyp-type peroxidase domain-containing protein n=1 Tax=Kitasatospora sp. MAP5-34 TaxID=3035102 RepID=UPI0024762386
MTTQNEKNVTTGSCPFPHQSVAAAQPPQEPAATGCPAGPARRSFLGAALGVGATSAALAGGALTLIGAGRSEAADAGGVNAAVPFHGEHQAGILTPQPAAAAFVSFDVVAQDRKALEELFHTLTERIRFLTAGGTPLSLGVGAPPS